MQASCVELLFSVENCRAELSTKMHKNLKWRQCFWASLNLLIDMVRNYVNHDNDDIYLASNDWPRICDKFLESLGMSNAYNKN